ncbi:MAG: family 78 glycoside hydrolase catalytic domain, partial [Acidobacteria bacterium]|nr:family 78 glycoside hydrolase catalytic domain [Acidobacteriota bacterium]
QNGTASEWSKPALWTMGLLEPDAWSGSWMGLDEPAPASPPWFPGAQWIWFPQGNPKEAAPLGRCWFRREVELPEGRRVAEAHLSLIADAKCRAVINRTAAGEVGSVRTDDCWKKPLPMDVRALLRPGRNVLAVEAENNSRVPWKAGQKPNAPNPAGVIGVLRIRFEDGLELAIPTDRNWQASHTAGSGAWLSAMELGSFGSEPWNKVHPDEYTTLPARMFRREFELQPGIRRATAYLCGLGYSELYLNGRRVGDHAMDPILSDYEKKVHYVTYDVTGALRPGRNAAGILLGNAAFFAYRQKVPAPFRSFGYPKALLNIRIEFEDGSVQDMVSDGDWKVTTDGPIRANNEYDGEIYDARREQRGWAEPGFDAAAWRPAKLVEPPGGKLSAQMVEPQRITETLRPLAITEPLPGTWVVDFGQTFNGWVRLRATGPAGTGIQVRRAGLLREDGMIRREDSRSALMTDVFILAGRGAETWSPRFSSQGGRYIEVTGYPGRPSAESFEGLVIHTDMQADGRFECSHELTNRLYQMMRWSQRVEARGVPLDCSTRDERMPWISEHHGMDGHGYLFRVAAMYTNWLEDIRLAQRGNGSIPNVAPSFWTFGQGVVWPVTLVYLPTWFHQFYGDRRAVERNYAAMKRLVRFMRDTYLKPDGTIDYNDHGDWLDASAMDGVVPDDGRAHPFVGATPQPLISSAFFYFYCTILERHARLLGLRGDAAQFAELGTRVREGFERRFFDAGANAYAGRTQTSYVLPLAFGLVPEARRAAVAANLAADVVRHKGHTTCGFMGVQWVLSVLSETGHHDAAWSILTRTERPSWGYMLSKGATTMWERWDHDTADPTMTGESQYFLGANIAGWIFQNLGGINPDPERPGFRHIILRPRPVAGLDWVKCSYESLYGRIVSEWRIADGRFRWRVEIPANTTATVFVPGSAPRQEGSGVYEFEGATPPGAGRP